MPKIIENLREKILVEAGKILTTEGYNDLTVRKVANRLGIGIGTIYNYFSSKEDLTAGVMLADWQREMHYFEQSLTGQPPEELLSSLFSLIRSYSIRYSPAWEDYAHRSDPTPLFTRYHKLLIDQLADLISRVLPEDQLKDEPALTVFLAEIILRFSSDTVTDYETIRPGLEKLLRRP